MEVDEEGEVDDHECNTYFHFLCGWFNGMFFDASVTDDSFRRDPNDPVYPYGLSMKGYCEKHVPSPHKETRNRELQTKIRARYKVPVLACRPAPPLPASDD